MSAGNDLPSPSHGRVVLGEGRLAAAIYTGLSLAAGLAFLTVTLVSGDYSWVARIGGAIWVFGLCMIILMPTVTPLVRGRRRV